MCELHTKNKNKFIGDDEMKKKISLMLISVMVIAMLLMVACKPSISESQLIGKWSIVAYDGALTLNADHSYHFWKSEYKGDFYSDRGTWSLSDKNLTMTTDGGETHSFTIRMSNNRLYLGETEYKRK